MRTIFKYPLNITVRQTVNIPPGFTVRLVAAQNDVLTFWAEVETDSPPQGVTVYIVGTGFDMNEHLPRHARHVGSAVVGAYVWHVFI